MKKLLGIALTILLLVGCSSNATTQISNKDEVLFKIEDAAITRGDVYSMLRFQQIGQIIVNDAQQKLIETKVELTDDIKKEAETSLKEAKEQFGDYFAVYYGNSDDETLMEQIFIPAARQKVLLSNYYEENTDTLIKELEPVKVHVLYYDSEETATTAKNKLEQGSSVAEVITELGANSNHGVNREEPQIMSKTKLPEVVKSFIESEEGKLKEWSKTPLKDVSETKFYVVKLIEDDSNALKDEYKANFLNDQEATNKVFTSLFKEAKFNVYDQAIYDGIKANDQLTDFHPGN